MIKRSYFMCCKKLHGDGNGSYSFNYFVANRTSWFPRPAEVFDEALEEAKRALGDELGKNYEVVSFNRI